MSGSAGAPRGRKSRCASSDRASSIAKNGLPPEISWSRRRAARGNDVPRAWTTTSCSAWASSAPIATCSTSTSARPSPSGGSASGADRWARRTLSGASLSRRNANASARADAPSSHWTSSIARSVGPHRATSLSTDRNAAPTARSSGGVPSASSRSNATRSAVNCGVGSAGPTSSRTSATMSASPVKARPASASTGRVTSTRNPCLRAASSAAAHTVVLPMPASPWSTSTAVAPRPRSTNCATARSSASRPTTVADSAVTARRYTSPASPHANRAPACSIAPTTLTSSATRDPREAGAAAGASSLPPRTNSRSSTRPALSVALHGKR